MPPDSDEHTGPEYPRPVCHRAAQASVFIIFEEQ